MFDGQTYPESGWCAELGTEGKLRHKHPSLMPISQPLGPLNIYVDTLTHLIKGKDTLLKVILLIFKK